jgi:S-DNA-T family DNA segregation ATPase FtsK/SpoIIIE
MADKNAQPKKAPNGPPGKSKVTPVPEAQPSGMEQGLNLLARFCRFFWDIGGVALLALAFMTLLALLAPAWSGGVLRWWVNALQLWLGWGCVWVVSAIAVGGLWMLFHQDSNRPPVIRWGRVLAMELAALSSIALLTIFGGASIARAEAGLDGGRIGWGMVELLRILLSPIGLGGLFWQALFFLIIFILGLVVGLGLVGYFLNRSRRQLSGSAPNYESYRATGPVVSTSAVAGGKTQPVVVGGASAQKKRPPLPAEYRKNFRIEPVDEEPAAPRGRDERLPPVDLLLPEQSARRDERNINLTAGLIEKTLAEFGIPAKVVGFRVGPTVTQFAVEPGFVEKDKNGLEGDPNRQKVRVAQIASLQRDLALALSAERLRIEAPVPGRPYVGVEVPNVRSVTVRLRPILESETFYNVSSPLTIALGRDVSGQPVVADLARMPHLLVAGTTGSGKSVCIAAITTCLVMNNAPEELRLVMIDPKMVELVRFNGLPHLLGKVETDLEHILLTLRWTVVEMDRRYKLLEATHARNIDSYNRKASKKSGIEYLPRIVVLIDELADLMMSAPDQTEHNLVRLAQMARAVGIHLVIATQRPSTDVVTGLIKANFPARISFAVTSQVDSRVILDQVGAESLLGRGDMLFTPPEATAPVRSQGALVTDQEIEKVITFWQKAYPLSGQAEPSPWEIMLEEEQVLADKDDLINKAIAMVRDTQHASASLLQRRLRIGYPRAARLMDELEELGIIGPSQGGGREREVLIDKNDPTAYHLDEEN